MRGDTEVILFICFGLGGFFLGTAMSAESVVPFVNAVISPLVTLAAAFFGASYAFKLQNAKAKLEADSNSVKAINKAIFDLIRTHNKFLAIDKQFVAEHREKGDRHLTILPASGISFEPIRFDYDSLSILFSGADPNLLGTLAMVEQEIASTIEVIQDRSKFHLEQFQPAVELAEATHGRTLTLDIIESALGTRRLQTLVMSTDYMVDGIDAVLRGSKRHIELLYSAAKAIFPGHRFLRMTLPDSALAPEAADSNESIAAHSSAIPAT